MRKCCTPNVQPKGWSDIYYIQYIFTTLPWEHTIFRSQEGGIYHHTRPRVYYVYLAEKHTYIVYKPDGVGGVGVGGGGGGR